MKKLDCCCGNCKFMKDAEDVGFWGPYCSRIMHVQLQGAFDAPYLVGRVSAEVYAIVEKGFLCSKWQPKEV